MESPGAHLCYTAYCTVVLVAWPTSSGKCCRPSGSPEVAIDGADGPSSALGSLVDSY